MFTCYFCWRLTAAKNFIQLRLSIRSQRLWRSIYVTSSVSYVTFQLYKSFKSQFALHNTFTEHIKATFHCSSQLQSWSNDQVCDQVADKFVRVCDTLSTFLSKTCREPAASISTCRQVRWFVRVLDKWNVEKKPVLSKFAAGFRHACDLLATRCTQGLQLARIMECGLYKYSQQGTVFNQSINHFARI